MKKWEDPKIMNLDLKETKGGTNFNEIPDGDYYQDKSGRWHRDFGS